MAINTSPLNDVLQSKNHSKLSSEEIAKAVSLQPAAGLEAVLKEAGEQRRILAERDHAIAYVSRRKHIELAA